MTPIQSLKRFKVDKLIRDKLPELVNSKGVIHKLVMENRKFIYRLKEKLIEKSKEVTQAQARAELVEELADVLEVLYNLAQENEISIEEIEKLRLNKKELKGGFEGRVYNPFIDIRKDNPAIEYYLAKASQYAQINKHQNSCIFCQIAGKEKKPDVISSFKHCFVKKDQFPVSEGHLLIIPHEHTLNWFTTTEEVRLDIMNVLAIMKARLDEEYKPDGYNIGANCGEFAGQTIMHLHVHLIPRYKGDMEDPKGGVRGVIPGKQKY